MAILIKELADLPYEGMKYVLSHMLDDYFPLELNGRVFLIPKEVNDFIDLLYTQVKEKKQKSPKQQ